MVMFQMVCTCGEAMRVEASNRTEAAGKLKAQMDAATIAAHMKFRHPGEAIPSAQAVHARIDRGINIA